MHSMGMGQGGMMVREQAAPTLDCGMAGCSRARVHGVLQAVALLAGPVLWHSEQKARAAAAGSRA